jgi:hypothetical protein
VRLLVGVAVVGRPYYDGLAEVHYFYFDGGGDLNFLAGNDDFVLMERGFRPVRLRRIALSASELCLLVCFLIFVKDTDCILTVRNTSLR